MQSFSGYVMDTRLPQGRVADRFSIAEGWVLATDHPEYRLSVHSIKVQAGGTASRILYLSDSNSSFTICITDPNFLKPLEQAAGHHLLGDIKGAKRGLSEIKWVIGGAFGVFVIALVALFWYRVEIVRSLAFTVPQRYEVTLGETYMKQLTITDQLDTTSQAFQIFNEKAQTVLKGIDSEVPFRVYISSDTSINAFALPGGFMVFNKGLLQAANTWEEVLGVLAHECAHVTERHIVRGMISKLGTFTILSMMFGDGSALTDLIFGVGANLEELSYSRIFEKEADLKAVDYLVKAGYNPKGMLDFFDILQSRYGNLTKIPAILSTHPPVPDRQAYIEAYLTKLGKSQQQDAKTYASYLPFKELVNQDSIPTAKEGL